MPDIIVLCYHGISDDWVSPLAVTRQDFHDQLSFLLARGYSGVRFCDAADPAGPKRRLVVTFDDGYRSVGERAAPILATLGLPATVFVPTEYVTRAEPAAWPGMEDDLHGPHGHELELMGWEQLGELHRRGWEIGSHTQRHPHLPEVGDRELADELRGSKAILEERLGAPCLTLAYPYGDTDSRVMAAAVDAGYVLAAGLPARRLHAPLAMNWPRIGVYDIDRRWRFRLKAFPPVRRLRTFAITSTPTARTDGPAPEVVGATPGSTAPPRVAVIIPCFNDGELVLEAIESINEAEPIELVVVDDTSTDPGTLAVLEAVRSRGIRVIRHPHNGGLPAARMTGLAATRAPYVFPLDSDDLAVPGALAGLADRLDAVPEAAVCFGDYAEFGDRHHIRRVPARLDSYRVAYRNDYPVSSMFRRSALQSVGGWQAVGEEVGYEDWNLWMTFAERGALGIHWGRGVAVRRRLHGHRMLTDAGKKHYKLYATLRTLHPRLFGRLSEYKRETDLGLVKRELYPIVFGWRPPLSLRSRLEPVLRRRGDG